MDTASAEGARWLGPTGLVNREEYVRVLGEALQRLGYGAAAKALEEESGVAPHAPPVRELRDSVLAGGWDRCLELLQELGGGEGTGAAFAVLRHKYLEHLANGATKEALWCLRNELAPAAGGARPADLRDLAALVMCRDRADLEARLEAAGTDAGEAGEAGEGGALSRNRLLKQLQLDLPASTMLPEGRLEELVEQALRAQVARCLFHNDRAGPLSLLRDYTCGREQLPTETLQVLEEHDNEVWHIEFSHDGTRLASASKDMTAIVWRLNGDRSVERLHTLTGHTAAIAFLSWSPDDRFLVTCGSDHRVKLWDAVSGTCLQTLLRHSDHVTAAAWLPDSKFFVSAGVDKRLYMWDLQGNELREWKGNRVNDMGITADGQLIVTVCSERKIRLMDLRSDRDETITESDSITSMCLSRDGRDVLVNLANQEVHLWDISQDSLPQAPTFKYRSAPEKQQGRYVIRSCFGGKGDAFVVSGGEDSRIRIWHREKGELLETLAGHSGTVNAVAWNPVDPWMFASASDDRTIRIWVAQKALSSPLQPAYVSGDPD